MKLLAVRLAKKFCLLVAQTQWSKIRLGEAAGTARRLRSVSDRGATCGAGNGTTRLAVAFMRTKLIEQVTGLCLDSSLTHKSARLFQSTTRFSDFLVVYKVVRLNRSLGDTIGATIMHS